MIWTCARFMNVSKAYSRLRWGTSNTICAAFGKTSFDPKPLPFLIDQDVVNRLAVGPDTALGDGSGFPIPGDFPFFDDELFALQITDPLDGVVVDTIHDNHLSRHGAVTRFRSRVFLSI